MDTSIYIPGISIDCVIFGFHEQFLKVLLIRMKNMDKWSLPGGFIDKEKNVDEAAKDVLKMRTGLSDIYLKQFSLFGERNRNSSEHVNELIIKSVIFEEDREWFDRRFMTIGYYALVEYSKVVAPTPDDFSDDISWFDIHEVPNLILDHKEILSKAYIELNREVNFHPIGIDLLEDEFTMTELQSLYETILGKSLDRRNFRRKMLNYGILVDTGKTRTGKGHKSPILYRFDQQKYMEAVESGFSSNW